MYAHTKKKITQDAHTKVFGDNNISQVVARACRLELWVGLVLVMPSLQWGAPQHFFHQVAIEGTLKILQWMCSKHQYMKSYQSSTKFIMVHNIHARHMMP
jgi:hypothetical protein